MNHCNVTTPERTGACDASRRNRRDRIGLALMLALWPAHLAAWTYCTGALLIPNP